MAPKKVLIVDDDAEFLEELKEMLVLSGYDVTAVNKSVSALETVRSVMPDVILLDLKMSDMSGFEVAEAIKRLSETSHIPIIAMTGFYAIKEPSWLLNFCDIEKCLKKPFSSQDAIDHIEDALKKGGDKNGKTKRG